MLRKYSTKPSSASGPSTASRTSHSPSICTQASFQSSESTKTLTLGCRRALRVFGAFGYVAMTIRPLSSTPPLTGDD